MNRQRAILPAAIALSLAGYIYIGYFVVRSDFTQILLAFAVIFGLYLVTLHGKIVSTNVKLAVAAALLFRFVLLFMTPNLTDDYFRFVWDGMIVAGGHSPYMTTPSAFMLNTQSAPGINPAIYERLNSPDYYSVYPPLCQYIFGLGAKICGSNVFANIILLRVLIYLAETGSIWLLFKISNHIKAPKIAPFIYALNPLVIIELSGNLHPEAFEIFFLLLGIYFIVLHRHTYSAMSVGCAVGVKLIPLIFLPLLIKRLGLVNSIKYFLVVGATFVLLSAPFLSLQAIYNFASGLALYFRVFEFNASIYYLARWIGYGIAGYNTIAVVGTGLAAISAIAIVIVAWLEKGKNWGSLFDGMVFCLTIYLLFATTVHPWYLTTLVALSALTTYRYGLIWSLLAMLSYSAYQTRPYSENLWLVTVEYVFLVVYIACEMAIKRKQPDFDMLSKGAVGCDNAG